MPIYENPLLWAVIVLALILFWVIATANRFASMRNTVKESWSDLDVALERRHDLIPNLVTTVKNYAHYEQSVLENVIQAREGAIASRGSVTAQAHNEEKLGGALMNFMARAEAYPDLKASDEFANLQSQLTDTEDKIAAARRLYNANVRDFNAALQSFPSGTLGRAFGNTDQPFFQVEDASIREAPVVPEF